MKEPKRFTKEEVLEYHSREPRGKISVTPTKPTATQRDLSIAYSPGVAIPCMEIAGDADLAYKYTAKGNLVAVISNGTAVLGLGNIGAAAGKPVMEGKGVLMKKFADIDVFDIEVTTQDPDEFITVVKNLTPTFGAINLEDIKAPECFYIEEKLKEICEIPIFHDDQHGTAIISGAGLVNACELQGKELDKVKIVVAGGGAAAVSCAKFYVELGADLKNITMVDSKGVIFKGRKEGMNPYKELFAHADDGRRTIADALQGADVFVGLAVKGLVTAQMLKTMAQKPIVFAMANPDPEIPYAEAKAARPDAIVGTGRSDFPNQVNNVLGYPYIFRGALDVRAKAINEAMKVAAAKALAELAKEDVPDEVIRAYGNDPISFGPEYVIPKPFDPRVLLFVAPAIAKAAMDSGVARRQLDLSLYRDALEARLGKEREMMRIVINKARRHPKRVVFPEGNEEKILRACQIVHDEGIAQPVLLGRAEEIRARMAELNLDFPAEIVDPRASKKLDGFIEDYLRLRQRKGVTRSEAETTMRRDRNAFGAMMVCKGEADALVSGIGTHYPDALRPALQIIGLAPGTQKAVGLYMMTLKNKVFFLADATVNIDPTAEDLAEIAIQAAKVARQFDVTPRVAMLSFSNFGSTRHPFAEKVARATKLVKERAPGLVVDGELQADTAVVPELLAEYPFSALTEPANVLIFPDLQSANIAYKLLQRLSDAEATGPILEGMAKPVHILQRGDDVRDVVNMTAIAVLEAQSDAERDEGSIRSAHKGARPSG
ncbi:MAG TPA: NADP-dependent malic enzyme [Candidatus Thermoplasmatota archaeon]|nr:NADP-dependent malic enzyme [Candidatus Thermoplasmatota archaeon]